MQPRTTRFAILLTLFAMGAAPPSFAQLAAPNAAGVSMGHIHLNVSNIAEDSEIWAKLGGRREPGRLNMLEFPGVYILLTEREPSAWSTDTSINHIAFGIRDYAAYKTALEDLNADVFFDSEDSGQILADLPDGVRVEFLVVEGQTEPIAFHHVHLVTDDVEGLRDWYVKVFGAEPSERRGLPSAIIPGGTIDVMDARGDHPRGSRGAAIDHVGFEVTDMGAFTARMRDLGIAFDVAPRRVESIGLTIAFITDPVGTYIEITEGLARLAGRD